MLIKMNWIDQEISQLYSRLLNTNNHELSAAELIMKQSKIDSINRYENTFNNDLEIIRDDNGDIFAYKGPTFKF